MLKDSTVDVLNRSLGWRSHVDVEEVSLESWWDVVTATTWMVHGCKIHQVFNDFQVSNIILVQEVNSFLLNKLSCNLKSFLITPVVDERHGDIIKEHSHLFVLWWSVGLNLLLLNFSLN